jgi:SAM-dependent methyltransferase
MYAHRRLRAGTGGMISGMRAETATYWNGEAATFDTEPDHGLLDPVVRAAWTELLVPLMATASARVADVGSGTGSLAVLLAQAGHLLFGLDVAARMIDVAKAKATAAGVQVDFAVGDAGAPPWRAGMFDVVLIRHVLWALPDPDAAIRGWTELLNPNGRLVLVEGRWCTGGGLGAGDVVDLVLRHRREATVTRLDDPALWGKRVDDERYLLVSRF